MQQTVDKALLWGQQNGLAFSAPKMVVVLFTRKRKFNLPSRIKMGDIEIPYSETVRYLGVILDSATVMERSPASQGEECQGPCSSNEECHG